MARFLKQPQQQIVQMGSPIDVDFYSRLLERDQQNRNQAVGMQMEYIDKINNLPIYTEEDRAATTGKIQERLSSLLDKSFVTPSQMARSVMELNQEITPGIQALKAKDQAAQMYDKMRLQYGANALMGTDPRNINITDESGRYRDPGSYRAVGVNLEDIDKRFLTTQGARLTENRGLEYIQGKGIDVNGIPLGEVQVRERKGLTPEELQREYAPGSPTAVAEASMQIQTSPEILDIFNGDREKAMKFIMDRNYQTAMVKGQEVSYSTRTDQTYVDPYNQSLMDSRKKQGTQNPFKTTRSFAPTQQGTIEFNPFTENIYNNFNSSLSTVLKISGTDSLPKEDEFSTKYIQYIQKTGVGSSDRALEASFKKGEEIKKSIPVIREMLKTARKNLKEDPIIIENNIDVDKLSDIEISEYIETKQDLLKHEAPLYYPLSYDASKAINEFTSINPSFINDKSYRIAGEDKQLPLSEIAKEIGVKEQVLRSQLQSGRYNYNRSTGEFFVEVPTDIVYSNKTGKGYPTEDSKTKKVYMNQLDVTTGNYSILLKTLKKVHSTETPEPIIYSPDPRISFQYLGGNKKLFKIKDSNGEYIDDYGKTDFTFTEIQEYIADIIDNHIETNYILPRMNKNEKDAYISNIPTE